MRLPRRNIARVGLAATGILAASMAFTMFMAPEPAGAGKRDKDVQGWREERDFEWSGLISRGDKIAIHGVNGDIVAVGGSGSQVEVSAVKKGRRSDPDEVRIEVTEHRSGVTICVLYPDRNGDYSDCGAEGIQQSVKNNDVRVDFRVRVPAGVRFVGKTVNGKIEAERLNGPVSVSTVNGSVAIATDDVGEASTVNGSITASLGVSRWSDELAFSTVNGSITLDCPEDLSATLNASTVNGTISTDFPMTVRGKFSRRHITGSVGREAGSGELSLSTVNGSIRLRSGQ